VLVLALLIGAAGCARHKTQAPTLALERVHANGAHRIAFDAAGRRLASGGLHGDVVVWSLPGGNALQRLPPHSDSIRGLAWLGEQQVLSADQSGGIRIHDLSASRTLASVQLDAVQALSVSPDKQQVLVAEGGAIRVLQASTLRTAKRVDIGSPVLALAISHDGNRVAVSTRDGRVMLLDSKLMLLKELTSPSRDAFDLRFAPDDKTLLAGGWFRLLVWDLQTGALDEFPTEHLGKVISVDISPDGALWLSLGRTTDSSLRLVDADSQEVLRRFQSHDLCGWQARFSPDGRYVASSAEDGSIYIYDLQQPYRPVASWPEFVD